MGTDMMTGTSTTTTTAEPKVLTTDMLERMVQLLESLPPEPIGEYMRSKGHPPEHWTLILPAAMREELDVIRAGQFGWPEYVVFSPLVSKPLFAINLLRYRPQWLAPIKGEF